MSSPPLVPEAIGNDSLVTIEGLVTDLPSQPRDRGEDAASNALLDVPLEAAFRKNSVDTVSNLSVNSGNSERLLSLNPSARTPYLPTSKTWRARLRDFWIEYKGCCLVLMAQFFGAFMGATTRLLETDGAHGKGMHPFQILFVRMIITVICSSLYLYYAQVPDAPWGKRPIRTLLVMRGVGGFFGVVGFYYSLLYLPLAEATVLTFLAPILACWICSFVLREPFTRTQQIGGLISLVGVILIARPVSVFSALRSSSSSSSTPAGSGSSDRYPVTNSTSGNPFESHAHPPSPLEHVYAVLFALLGVGGAAATYTSIRWIGTRAHPLISVNYFSILCTFVSTVCLTVIPSVSFRLPGNATEWTLLLVLGASGFVMQFMMTAGLAYNPDAARVQAYCSSRLTGSDGQDQSLPEKAGTSGGSKATSMLYTNMLFALIFDKLIWGASPSFVSWAGSALILGSTIWVALKKEEGKTSPTEIVNRRKEAEEGRRLMEGNDAGEGSAGRRVELRNWDEVQLRALR